MWSREWNAISGNTAAHKYWADTKAGKAVPSRITANLIVALERRMARILTPEEVKQLSDEKSELSKVSSAIKDLARRSRLSPTADPNKDHDPQGDKDVNLNLFVECCLSQMKIEDKHPHPVKIPELRLPPLSKKPHIAPARIRVRTREQIGKIGNIEVVEFKGNITDAAAEAIVCPADFRYRFNANIPLHMAIRDKYGSDIFDKAQREAISHMNAFGLTVYRISPLHTVDGLPYFMMKIFPLEETATQRSASKLTPSKIIFVNSLLVSGQIICNEEVVKQSILYMLADARKSGISTIAIPSFPGMDETASSKAIRDGINRFVKVYQKPDDETIVKRILLIK